MSGIVEQLVDDMTKISFKNKVVWINFKDSYPVEPNIIATCDKNKNGIRIFVKSNIGKYYWIDNIHNNKPLMDKEVLIRTMIENNLEGYWTELDLNYLTESIKILI